MESCINDIQKVIHKSRVIYPNDKERRKGYLQAQNRFASKSWPCDLCNRSLRLGTKTNHLRSKIHYLNELKNMYKTT